MSKDVTIRNLDNDSLEWIEREAQRRGLTPEEIARELIRKGIPSLQGERPGLPSYHDLDTLAGTWNEEETKSFLQQIADFGRVDEELWR